MHEPVPTPEEAARTLRVFLPDGRLTRLPAREKRKIAILQEITRRLPERETFSEREIDDALHAFHDDHCTLRRALVDRRLLARADGVYAFTAHGRALRTGGDHDTPDSSVAPGA